MRNYETDTNLQNQKNKNEGTNKKRCKNNVSRIILHVEWNIF
jgi:hypothetical protein